MNSLRYKIIPLEGEERFFLDYDIDGYLHLVPVSRRAEWNEWLGLLPEEPSVDCVPDYARPVNGSIVELTFSDPKLPGE